MKHFLVSSAISLIGVILALAILEVGVRIFVPDEASPAATWSDRPIFYYSAAGRPSMQGKPYRVPKPPSTFRIAVIGDSFSFAPFMQFTDTFAAKLEEMLNLNDVRMKAEVINYGVPAYSSTHEIEVAKRALDEGADLLLLQITLNDPELKTERPTGLAENLVDQFGPFKLEGKLGAVARRWKTLRFALERIHNSRTRDAYIRYFNNLFENPRNLYPFTNALRDMIGSARKAQKPIVSVVFPLFGLPLDDRYPFYPLHEKMRHFMSVNQVPHLDVSSIYDGIPLERLQVIPGVDRHPNEIAHRMAAERMYLWLEEQKLLPKELLISQKFATRLGITPQRPWISPQNGSSTEK
jgi:hypothetical protein